MKRGGPLRRSSPMKRGALKQAAPLERVRSPVGRLQLVPNYRPNQTAAAPIVKGPKAKPGKRAPTVEEAAWMSWIVSIGCIACRLDGHAPRPTAVHHLLSGGRRIGHLFTLPLCDTMQGGHHQNGAALGLISRHPYKAQFERRYGTEMELLSLLQLEYAKRAA